MMKILGSGCVRSPLAPIAYRAANYRQLIGHGLCRAILASRCSENGRKASSAPKNDPS